MKIVFTNVDGPVHMPRAIEREYTYARVEFERNGVPYRATLMTWPADERIYDAETGKAKDWHVSQWSLEREQYHARAGGKRWIRVPESVSADMLKTAIVRSFLESLPAEAAK